MTKSIWVHPLLVVIVVVALGKVNAAALHEDHHHRLAKFHTEFELPVTKNKNNKVSKY